MKKLLFIFICLHLGHAEAAPKCKYNPWDLIHEVISANHFPTKEEITSIEPNIEFVASGQPTVTCPNFKKFFGAYQVRDLDKKNICPDIKIEKVKKAVSLEVKGFHHFIGVNTGMDRLMGFKSPVMGHKHLLVRTTLEDGLLSESWQTFKYDEDKQAVVYESLGGFYVKLEGKDLLITQSKFIGEADTVDCEYERIK